MPAPRLPFKPLANVLENEAHLASWLRRHRMEAELTRIIRAQLPRLIAEQIRVTDLRAQQIEITVASGTLATVIRQRTQALLAALATQAYEFNGIRVRVQPINPHRRPPAPNRRAPPPAAPFLTLSRQLPEGPLKQAILRLIRQR